jgi:ATP-binding cassette subfamily B protein
LTLARAIWQAGHLPSALLAILVLARSLAPLAFALAVAQVLTAIPDALRDGVDSAAGSRLTSAVVWMTVAFVVQQAAPMLSDMVSESGLGLRLTQALDQKLMRACIGPSGTGHLEDPAVTAPLAAVRQGVGGWPRAGDGVNCLAGRLGLHLGLLSGSALLVPFSWLAAVAVLVTGELLQARTATAMAALGANNSDVARMLRETTYVAALGLRADAAKEVRVFGLGPWLVARHQSAWGRAADVLAAERGDGQRRVRRATRLACLVLSLVVVALAWRTARGHVELQALVLAVQGLMLVANTLGDPRAIRDGVILGFARASMEGTTSLEDELQRRSTQSRGGVSADGLPRETIRFDGVRFGYPGADREVLTGLDLTIPVGTSLGIVGLNGAGKTTLLKLLCGLYEPTAGAITVDGTDLREIDPSQWQRRVAAIFQDYVRYPFSAADNVTLGDADERLLDEVAASVGLTEVVAELPDGWQTSLAADAGGADLSGGQWQRLALARAVYAARAGAPLLVLDEPTASLDVRAEAQVYERFLDLTADRTTILISHRLSSVRRADRIAVIENGRVLEVGSHDALLTADGRYAELWRLQSAAFTAEPEVAP